MGKNEHCRVKFNEIFCDSQYFKLVEIIFPDSYLEKMEFDFILTYSEGMDFSGKILTSHSRIFVNSCHRFFQNTDVFKSLVLVPELPDKILKYSKELGLDKAIGLHIRRTDYIGVLNNKSLEVFIKIVKGETSKIVR